MPIHVKDLPSTRNHVLGKDSGYFPAIAAPSGEVGVSKMGRKS